MNSNQIRRSSPPPPAEKQGPSSNAGGEAAAREFAQALAKKRSASQNQPRPPRLNEPTREDQGLRSTNDPRDGQVNAFTWTDLDANAGGQDSDTTFDPLGEQLSIQRADKETVSDGLRMAETNESRSESIKDADELEPLLASQVSEDVGSQGKFELLLPNDQKIGVEYAVSAESAQVLLTANSRELSRRLQACAEGISQRMSQRSGRRVDVFAA